MNKYKKFRKNVGSFGRQKLNSNLNFSKFQEIIPWNLIESSKFITKMKMKSHAVVVATLWCLCNFMFFPCSFISGTSAILNTILLCHRLNNIHWQFLIVNLYEICCLTPCRMLEKYNIYSFRNILMDFLHLCFKILILNTFSTG